ncbi:MAG: PKD domain-containing protein, partial [Promethearchaeota archaeon]
YYVNKTDLDASNFTNAGQVFLINCNNSVISGLNTSRTSTGISLYYSSNNLISENYANDNTDRGISLSKANNNNISGNILINNDQYGLFISLNSENNKAWLNSFLDNGIHANDDGTNNQWDNGSVGNFWDDYEGVDTEEPYGIGDISYFFENGEDRFPLMDTVPNVNFIANATNIILGGTIQFTYTGTGGNIPLAYEWDFGDGNDSSERDPVHRYGWNDTFLVSLTVTDIDGDSDTNTTTIIVELDTIPVASFGANATHIVEGQGVQFYYNGTGGNAPLTYEWYFGDETPPSNETNPVHVYAMNGTYTVNLTVIDVNGDSSNHSIEGYIEVEDDTIPALNFTADSTNVIEGEAVQFYYNGTHGNYPLVYDWDFGDDTAHSNDENPLHLYAMNGTYMVNLTVIDANGDRVNLTRYDFITVDNLAPNLTFQESTVNVMVGQSIQFSYTLTSGNMPYTYSWNFGDGNISSDPHPWHQYETNGTFIVSLTVTDDDGDSVNASMTVHVEPARGGNPPRFPAEVLFSTFLVVGVATLGGIFTVKYKKKKSTALLTLGEYPSSGAKQAKNKGFLKAGSSTSHELLHESYVPGEISISTEQESSLKQQEELARTESEVDVQKQQFLCLVHKGPVEGVNIYLCPHCKAFYCRACVKALKEKGEKCWSCHQDFKL